MVDKALILAAGLLFITPLVCAGDIVPEWFLNDPDTQNHYFRGSSAWYVSDDYRSSDRSKKDALKNALSDVSGFFGVSVKSKLAIEKRANNTTFYTNFTKNTEIKTNQLILNFKPYKIYKEMSKDEAHFQTHILIRLTPSTVAEIKGAMEEDKKEFKKIIAQITTLINEQNLFQAKTLFQLAQGKRAAYIDDSLAQIKERLLELEFSMLHPIITLNKRRFTPDEEIGIEAALNQPGYLYLLYDTGSNTEMIFPNEYRRKSQVGKKDLIVFPSDEMNIIAYEESLGKQAKIIAVASKKYLKLKSMADSTSYGSYIFTDKLRYQKILKQCSQEGDCVIKEMPINISRIGSKSKANITIKAETYLKDKIYKALTQAGILSASSDYALSYNISTNRRYSKITLSTIEVNHIVAILKNKGRVIEKVVEECDPLDLNHVVVELYNELSSHIPSFYTQLQENNILLRKK